MDEIDESIIIPIFYLDFLSYFVSATVLLATFLVYALVRQLRNTPGLCVMCHVASLATTNIGWVAIKFLLLSNPELNNINVCACNEKNNVSNFGEPRDLHVVDVLSIVVHFAYLSSFTWLNVISYDICWALRDLRLPNRNGNQLNRRFLFYSIYAWGVPFIVVLVNVILHHFPIIMSNDFLFQITIPNAFFYVHLPVAIFMVANIIFFVIAAIWYFRAKKDTAMVANTSQAKQKFCVILSFFILMGLPWMINLIMEITALSTGGLNHYYYILMVNDIMNIVACVYIFVMFACKKKVCKSLKLKFLCFSNDEPIIPKV